MTGDNRAKYGRIGFTVFAGAVAIAYALIHIAGVGGRRNEYLTETYYDYPVSGLSVGSAVNFRGVKIGEVREIGFANSIYGNGHSTNDFQRISIVMALDTRRIEPDAGYPIDRIHEDFVRCGLRATIASNPVTGMSRIELNFHDNPQPLPQLSWRPRHPLIPPQPSLMENLAVALTRTLHRVNRMDFQNVWSNVASVAASTAEITRNVDEFIAEERAEFAEAVETFNSAAGMTGELVDRLKENPSLLLRSGDPEPLPETANE